MVTVCYIESSRDQADTRQPMRTSSARGPSASLRMVTGYTAASGLPTTQGSLSMETAGL